MKIISNSESLLFDPIHERRIDIINASLPPSIQTLPSNSRSSSSLSSFSTSMISTLDIHQQAKQIVQLERQKERGIKQTEHDNNPIHTTHDNIPTMQPLQLDSTSLNPIQFQLTLCLNTTVPEKLSV